MYQTTQISEMIQSGKMDEILEEIYRDRECVVYQKERYCKAVRKYEERFGVDDVCIFSAPGRSEIGGNHTDHQRGEVLVAAVNVDAIAVAHKTDEPTVKVFSEGYGQVELDLNELEPCPQEHGTMIALIKGVLAGIQQREYQVGGFNAYITSDVLNGAGLSSSAAFETLIGVIQSGLYNDMKVPDLEIAQVGQYAENIYFGKPCGLMDQMASSVGNLVHIDFKDEKQPVVDKIDCDLSSFGYSLCITDTKSSHADCTPEYAAVPNEMKAVASFFGKEVLRDVSKEELLTNIAKVRQNTGDRAILRAIHFVMENERVEKEVEALKNGDFAEFLQTVKASGESSFKYLQNVYMCKDIEHQNVSVALAISDVFLGENGVSRVHGGGFAGTIQAFVKNEAVPFYKSNMENVFGEGTCNVYRIRKYGGMRVV